ncbi:hypothetical protein KR222_004888, partial [Zaprionus bogoriensis]
NVLLLGDASVGKSCLLQRYTENRYSGHYQCTVGMEVRVRTLEIAGCRVKLQLWDTAGEERYRSVMSSYYRHVHGIILVFDTTRRQSYSHVDYWLDEIRKHAASGVSVLLVGSKCDACEQRQVCLETAARYAESQGLAYVEASAKSGANVERLFAKLAVSMFDRRTPPLTLPAVQLS